MRGEQPAIHWQGKDTDYATLQARVTAAARLLAQRNAPGDRIALLAWNCAAFVELLYAVPAAGLILVPLNARLAPAEWAYQLQNCGAKVLIAQDSFLQAINTMSDLPDGFDVCSLERDYSNAIDEATRDEAAEPPNLQPPATISAGDAAWLLYTSGSTGKPKGAVLSHRAIIAGLQSARLGRPVQPADKYYYPFPLFHVAAHNVILQHAFGAQVILAAAFNASDTLHACRELGVTTMSLAPTMIAMLMDEPSFEPEDLAGVRTIGYGASAMPLTLLQKLQSESSVGLCQSFGMTELCGSVAFLTVEDHRSAARSDPQLLQSVGKPLATAVIKIASESGKLCPPGEPGEILVNAAQCFSYYWGNPQATQSTIVDGWLHTGDIGKFDERGYLYIVDRKKDMIISGGENVASREVEEVLRAHPSVKDCAVIGLPDARWGERVTAVISLHDDIDEGSLNTHCRNALAGYKVPKRWIRVDSLPTNAGGKIDKPLLRNRYGANP